MSSGVNPRDFKDTMKEFREGTLVVLKGSEGGPLMVVELTRKDRLIATAWFAGDTLCRDAFSPEALSIITR